jgi:hypothetical protein
MDTTTIEQLDGSAAADALVSNRAALVEAEATEFELVAHWAMLHNEEGLADDGGNGRVLPGTERAVRVGSDGTPLVSEFAVGELACLLQRGWISAHNLLANALDVQHRHPQLWQSIRERRVRPWQASEVARRTRAADLTPEQAAWVDAQVAPYLSTLPWATFLALVEAKIIEADPEAAEARRMAAAMTQFVGTGQCNEFGLKTLVARANAGDVIVLVAMCDRIAEILAADGDDSLVGVRRARALGILARPADALALLEKHAVRESDLHPAQNDADDPEPERRPCPTCHGAGEVTGDPSAFVRPAPLDPRKLRPKGVLYVHVSREAFLTGRGVARVEGGIGPVTVQQAAEFLGHRDVAVKPVIDLAGQTAVDCYETPAAMREVVHLLRPRCTFPYSTSTSRSNDLDHPEPYVPMNKGGPPGQTDPYRLAPLTRRPHRLKTHGRGWLQLNPSPGVYLWRTRHGYWFRVDPDGTHPLGRDPDLRAHGAEPIPTSPAERILAQILLAHGSAG